ncbi:MAG: hypothetical protein JXD19_00395 [Deltaproteobacteria bacterium]|nr:hypothetical protein [Deltaproteobacteria bacterium]
MITGTLKYGAIAYGVILLTVGCSVSKIRSPIVFRSPVVLAKSEAKESASTQPSVDSGKQGAAISSGESPTSAQVSKEGVPASEAVATERVAAGGRDRARHSPAEIPLVSEGDILDEATAVLGRIRVRAPDEGGFSREIAIRELKVEAFKRFGSLAQGISNVEFHGEFSLLGSADKDYQEASGDVISFVEKADGLRDQPGVEGDVKENESAVSLEGLDFYSSEELFSRSFRVLGEVSVRERSESGFTREEALKALKIEAIKMYGGDAKGLTDVNLIEKEKIFYYTKVRKSISTPKETEVYSKASAEVIIWQD